MTPQIRGIAVVFERVFEPLLTADGVDQRIPVLCDPGCFNRSLRDLAHRKYVAGLVMNHDVGTSWLCSTVNGLEIWPDAGALHFQVRGDSRKTRAAIESVRRSCFREASVGFDNIVWGRERVRGKEVNVILEATIQELSIVRRGSCRGTYVRFGPLFA